MNSTAQETERSRIAADIHDDSVQSLAAVELRLGLLRRRMVGSAPDLLPMVDQLSHTVRAASDGLRHLLFELEPGRAFGTAEHPGLHRRTRAPLHFPYT